MNTGVLESATIELHRQAGFWGAPARLLRPVDLHLMSNLAAGREPGPIALAVGGRPGIGKTYTLQRRIEDYWGLRIVRLNASDLEGQYAGSPVKVLQAKIVEASNLITEDSALGAVVMCDDIDAGLGDWGAGVTSTTNKQQLLMALMKYADDPMYVEGQRVVPIPIVMTGNFLGRVYGPLFRPGRAQLLLWDLTLDELADFAAWRLDLDAASAADLIAQVPDISPAQLTEIANHENSRRFDPILEDVAAGRQTPCAAMQLVVENGVRIQTSAPDLQRFIAAAQNLVAGHSAAASDYSRGAQ